MSKNVVSPEWHLLKPVSIVIPALSRYVGPRDPVAAENLELTGFPSMPETSNRWVYWIFTLK